MIDFGTGTDGAFADGPEQLGITVSGATITVNTDTRSEYEFTSFELSAGKVLKVTGSAPLILRVLGQVSVAGTIEAKGLAGTSNASGTAGSYPGGTGVTGAGAGGSAGVGATAASAGGPASGDSRGGGLGAPGNLSLQYDGGGGGCVGTGPDAAHDATSGTMGSGGGNNEGVCPRTRTLVSADFDIGFSSVAAGAGGGGGGACTVGGSEVSGSAGGGGGGRVWIAALGTVTIAAGGEITLAGGSGGSINAGDTIDCGGGGGGGSGGVLWVQTAGTITGSGQVDIQGGAGGTSTTCGFPNVGGQGSRGIFRADTSVGQENVTVVPARTATTDSSQTVSYVTLGTYDVVTGKVPIPKGILDISSVDVTQGCGSSGTVEGWLIPSSDGVVYGDPIAFADLATQAKGVAAAKLKFRFQPAGGEPPCVTAIVVNYQLAEVSKFKIDGLPLGCGGLRSSSGDSSTDDSDRAPWLEFLFLLAGGAWFQRSRWFRQKAI